MKLVILLALLSFLALVAVVRVGRRVVVGVRSVKLHHWLNTHDSYYRHLQAEAEAARAFEGPTGHAEGRVRMYLLEQSLDAGVLSEAEFGRAAAAVRRQHGL